MITLPTINDTERTRLNKFVTKHGKKCENTVSIILTYTGVGVVIELRCNACHTIKDISDYSIW